ncbi:MAG: hypothetical protein ACYSTI_12335 [Planctomycetota bacterium]
MDPSTTPEGDPQAPTTPVASGGTNPNPAPAVEPEPVTSPAPVPTPEGDEPTPPVSTEPTPPTEPIPEPEPVEFNLPGDWKPQTAEEIDWYKQNYAKTATELADARRQIEEYQLSGLDDDEAAMEKFNRDRKNWQNEVDTWRQQQAVQQWGEYYAQFTDSPDEIKRMNDPIQMGHTVITELHQQLQKANAEIVALKKVVSTPSEGPPVTTGGVGTAGVRSLFELSPDERDKLMRKARMGQMKDGDIPPLKP